jgi:tripartite-type tricarboxylate transporter receptor subunit TctC
MKRRSLLALAALAPLPAGAQPAWPQRPVRLVVPYPPGGTTDIVARLVAQRITELWQDTGGRMFVENRAGAGGSIGTEHVARATPDGHTLVLGNSASHGANVLLAAQPSYDPVRDFAAISLLAFVRQALVLNNAVPARSVQELVAMAKAQPGRLTFSSSAVGGAPHLAAEMFRLATNIALTHVPYNGAAPALNAVLAGDVTMLFGSIPTVAELIRAGRLRAIGVASDSRSAMLPDLPTLAELGVPGVEADSWFGLLAPAGTPPAIIARLNADLLRATAGDEMARRMSDIGFERATGTPAAMAAHVQQEMARMRRLIADAGITG